MRRLEKEVSEQEAQQTKDSRNMDRHPLGTSSCCLRESGGLSDRFLCRTSRLPLSQSAVFFLELRDLLLNLRLFTARFTVLSRGDGYRCGKTRLLLGARFLLDRGLGFGSPGTVVAW